jgi:glycosyltransferase involved in cell wall biosynthesis
VTAAQGLHALRVADVPNAATAGMSGHLLSSSAEMEGRGHRVSFWFRDQLRPGISSPGIRRLVVPWLIVADVLAATRRGERFDVVEIHETRAGAYALVARLAGSRLPACAVLSFGLDERYWQAERVHLRAYGRRHSLKSRILVPLTLLSQSRLALRTAEAVLVLSSVDRDYVVERLGVPSERVTCAFTGVSGEHLFDLTRTPRRDARVLFLGSWIERKGTVELIAAWRRVVAERPGLRLTIAGTGDSERVRTDTAGLPGIDLVPTVTRDELPALLADHDVFVLPSWFEGMPLAMLEAAAAGLACVVSGVCGILDVFRPEDPQRDGAILVPASDADALYRALSTLAADGELRWRLGALARERARNFKWASNAERTIAAYVSAIERRRRFV